MIDLPDIVGQAEAVGRLEAYLAAGRLPHAMLFAGPVGVGRRTTALALARLLLCQKPSTDLTGRQTPCGSCRSCKQAAAGSHPDLNVITKELARYHDDPAVRNRVMQSLGIEVIRQFVIAPAGRAATGAGRKVFVLLEADLMSRDAQNCLLKTLEEPPPGVALILITDRPEQLLPTTLSRCGLVRFGPLPRGFVVQRLTDEGVDPAEADFWAGYTAGSLGRALKLTRAGMYDIKRSLADDLATLSVEGDATLGEKLASLADDLAEAQVKQVKKDEGANLSKNLATRQAAGTLLELLASLYRDAMALSTGAEPTVHTDQPDCIRALAQRFSPARHAEVLQQLSRFEQLLWRNVNAKTVWDNVVITLASAAPLGV
jgi:DNA polymerase III subunit delta'